MYRSGSWIVGPRPVHVGVSGSGGRLGCCSIVVGIERDAFHVRSKSVPVVEAVSEATTVLSEEHRSVPATNNGMTGATKAMLRRVTRSLEKSWSEGVNGMNMELSGSWTKAEARARMYSIGGSERGSPCGRSHCCRPLSCSHRRGPSRRRGRSWLKESPEGSWCLHFCC